MTMKAAFLRGALAGAFWVSGWFTGVYWEQRREPPAQYIRMYYQAESPPECPSGVSFTLPLIDALPTRVVSIHELKEHQVALCFGDR